MGTNHQCQDSSHGEHNLLHHGAQTLAIQTRATIQFSGVDPLQMEESSLGRRSGTWKSLIGIQIWTEPCE